MSSGAEFLKTYQADEIYAVIKSENAQAIAVTLSLLDPEASGAILRRFPQGTQTEILQRMAAMHSINDVAFEDLLATLESRLQDYVARHPAGKGTRGQGGRVIAAEVLRSLGEDHAERILAKLETLDQSLSSALRAEQFTMEDLFRVDKADLARVLASQKDETMIALLRLSSLNIQSLILSSLSQSRKQRIQEDAAGRKIKRQDAEQLRNEFLSLLQQRARDGRLKILNLDDKWVT
jgi:flagellar motor switch protein FliG